MFQSVTSGSKSADLPSSFSLSKDEKAYNGNPSLTAEKITCSENGLVPARGPRGSRGRETQAGAAPSAALCNEQKGG